jgi:hypothetical protein
MRRLHHALAVAVFASFLPVLTAQDDGKAAAEYERLVADWKAEQAAFREANQKIQATPEYKAAREAKDSAAIGELTKDLKRPDPGAFGKRALDLADRFRDDSARFVAYAAQTFANKDNGAALVERLTAKHLSSPALVEVLENGRGLFAAIGKDAAHEFLAKVAKESSLDQAKAWALYQRGNLLRSREPSPEDQAQMDALHAEAAKLATGELADRIAAPKFQEQRLQIGMAVPDIAGEDVDGVAFKLSDYRGKVVVLDFWGFW